MKEKVYQAIIEIIQGDITQQDTEAIANAANARLAGGGGVDGAIHRAGGPSIMEELRAKYQGCPTGSAVITRAGNLKAKYVLHAVGPIYSGSPEDAHLLSSAYRTCLELCSRYELVSIAFPSISTGAYGYPVGDASRVALTTVIEYLKNHPEIQLVRFVLFDSKTCQIYEETLKELVQAIRKNGN